jgi:hypothetical protein
MYWQLPRKLGLHQLDRGENAEDRGEHEPEGSVGEEEQHRAFDRLVDRRAAKVVGLKFRVRGGGIGLHDLLGRSGCGRRGGRCRSWGGSGCGAGVASNCGSRAAAAACLNCVGEPGTTWVLAWAFLARRVGRRVLSINSLLLCSVAETELRQILVLRLDDLGRVGQHVPDARGSWHRASNRHRTG